MSKSDGLSVTSDSTEGPGFSNPHGNRPLADPDPIVWRCTSYKQFSLGMRGMTSGAAYDDIVSTEGMSIYLKILESRGIDKVIIRRLGTRSYSLTLTFEKRAGADRIVDERKNHKLEDFYVDGEDNNENG